jgi:hypothetical protein
VATSVQGDAMTRRGEAVLVLERGNPRTVARIVPRVATDRIAPRVATDRIVPRVATDLIVLIVLIVLVDLIVGGNARPGLVAGPRETRSGHAMARRLAATATPVPGNSS